MMSHLLLILLGLTSVCSQETSNIREIKVINTKPQMPIQTQTSTSSKASPTNQQTKQSIINFDFQIIKKNIPDINIPDINIPDLSLPDINIPDLSLPDINIPDLSLPDINIPDLSLPDINIQIPKIDTEGIKSHLQGLQPKLQAVKQFFISASFYIVIGVLIGAILPFLLFLTLFLLGFTVAGIAAGSVAACCQPPQVVAGSCFSVLQSVGATFSIIHLTPYTAILGAISGLVFYVIKQIFEISINIDFEWLSKTLEQAGQFSLATLIDTGIGLLIGIVAPIVIFLCLIGLIIGLTSITSCFEPSSAAKIFRIIKLVKSGIDIMKFIPNTAILGACGGIVYSVFLK